MNFNVPILVKKYGSWVRVQVAFYDYLFIAASGLCPTHFTEAALDSVGVEPGMLLLEDCELPDENPFYEEMVEKLEDMFETPDAAWQAWMEELKGDDDEA